MPTFDMQIMKINITNSIATKRWLWYFVNKRFFIWSNHHKITAYVWFWVESLNVVYGRDIPIILATCNNKLKRHGKLGGRRKIKYLLVASLLVPTVEHSNVNCLANRRNKTSTHNFNVHYIRCHEKLNGCLPWFSPREWIVTRERKDFWTGEASPTHLHSPRNDAAYLATS